MRKNGNGKEPEVKVIALHVEELSDDPDKWKTFFRILAQLMEIHWPKEFPPASRSIRKAKVMESLADGDPSMQQLVRLVEFSARVHQLEAKTLDPEMDPMPASYFLDLLICAATMSGVAKDRNHATITILTGAMVVEQGLQR